MKTASFRDVPLFTTVCICLCASNRAFQPSNAFQVTKSSLIPPLHGLNHMQQILYMVQGDKTDLDTNIANIPSYVKSPVLQQVYPALLSHIEEYGNPNIPLGTTDGKRCKTLRRLAFQKKLSEEEMNLLTELEFRFNSLEDVYEEADFDHCLQRLIEYEKENKFNYQIPKKYKPDPELGAWVTMIRRIGSDNIDPTRRKKLDEIEFAWVSTRKCGSIFMKNFRPLKEKLESCCRLNEDGVWEVVDQDVVDEVLRGEGVMKWVRAQRDAAEKGKLSEHRCEYLDQLPGLNWRE
jgi:hypothetical protein